MNDRLLAVLSATRARLNTAIVAHRALAWAAPSAIAAGILVAAVRALGLGAPAFPLWAALVAAGAASGAFRAWKSRIGEEEAARWLDERLGEKELLSAALACIGRGSAGLFDARILSDAEELLPGAAALKAPPRPFAKRAGIACLACAIGAYLVFLASPIALTAGPKAASGGAKANAASLAKAASGGNAPDGDRAAASFAASLFPDDKRLAKLAERALLEGRLDDLRDMLKSADADYASRIDRSLSEAEKKRLTRARQMIQEASRAFAQGALGQGGGLRRGQGGGGQSSAPDGIAGVDGAHGQGGSRPGNDGYGSSGYGSSVPSNGEDRRGGYGPGQTGDGQDGSQGSLPGAKSDGSGGGQGSEGSPSGEGDQSLAGQGGAGAGKGGSGGSTAGIGAGSEGDWGTIRASNGKEAVLETSKKANFFELILPGRSSSAPISQLVPDSRKSAESAMAREGVPLEYEDFVRSYFIALSQGQ